MSASAALPAPVAMVAGDFDASPEKQLTNAGDHGVELLCSTRPICSVSAKSAVFAAPPLALTPSKVLCGWLLTRLQPPGQLLGVAIGDQRQQAGQNVAAFASGKQCARASCGGHVNRAASLKLALKNEGFSYLSEDQPCRHVADLRS